MGFPVTLGVKDTTRNILQSVETVSSLRLVIWEGFFRRVFLDFLALLNSEFSLTELSPAQSPRLECRRNVGGL